MKLEMNMLVNKSKWKSTRLGDAVVFNPKETLHKGMVATKIPMEALEPFVRDPLFCRYEEYRGGTKFRNGDTLLARITPCLENGKTAYIACLLEEEVAFGSTEYIVLRGQEKISDSLFIYYLTRSEFFRDIAIKSMVGSSGRQRVQQDVLEDICVLLPPLEEQTRIAEILSAFDDKIELNRKTNANLQQQAFALFDKMLADVVMDECALSDYAELNPKRVLAKNHIARSIDMSQLSTSGAFPSGWEMKPYNGGMRFSNGDTLLARITPCLENGKTAFIDFLDGNEVAFGSTEYIVLAPTEGVPPEFLYCLARYPKFVEYAVKSMNGSSGRQRVSAETVGQFMLPKLSDSMLKEFGTTVAPMFVKMRHNSLENIQLASLRDSLLPKLMSGEIDVSKVGV